MKEWWLWMLVAGLAVIEVVIFYRANKDPYPVYPMPLHPGTQVIDHEPGTWSPHRFKFINSTAVIAVETAEAGSECKKDVVLVGRVVQDGELRIETLDSRREFCATVEAGQWPMVIECWRPPSMTGGPLGCGRWRD